jgi:membrane fusion protein, copper/silver efflux system
MKKEYVVILMALMLGAGIVGGRFWKSKSMPKPATMGQAEVLKPKIMYTCAMHPHYISDKPGNCPICGMTLVPMDPVSQPNSPEEKTHNNGVKIDPTTVQNMGVRTEVIQRRDLQSEIRTSGKVKVDESKLTIINARVMGYVEKLRVNTTGQSIRKGQSLLELYSPDLVSTQEEYLQALRYAMSTMKTKGTEDTKGNEGAVGKTGTGSEDLVESSRRRLLNWGVSPSEIALLDKENRVHNTLSIVSPMNGVVLEKMVIEGQNIMPGMPLYRIADLSQVWIVANIYQRDLAQTTVGADAEVELSYRSSSSSQKGKPFRGKVTFISPVLDAETKTTEVRIEIKNTPNLELKPEMFATVRILAPALSQVLAVPEQAIIRSGRRNLAIIAMGGGAFEPRDVELGVTAGDYVEIRSGIEEGEKIVVSSQFLIDSESNLKAAVQQMQAPMADSNSETTMERGK